jgi:ubiquitin-conjugating enzyme E2 Q
MYKMVKKMAILALASSIHQPPLMNHFALMCSQLVCTIYKPSSQLSRACFQFERISMNTTQLQLRPSSECPQLYNRLKNSCDGTFFILDQERYINDFLLTKYSDICGYPKHNTYFLFTEAEHVPSPVTTAIDFLNQSTEGMNIEELLRHCSTKLFKALSPGSAVEAHLDDEDEFRHGAAAAAADDDEEDHLYDSDSDNDFDGWLTGSLSNQISKIVSSHHHLSADAITEVDNQIKKQLRTVKFAGFRIGILCGMKAESNSSMLCVSIRIAKLGLSAEAIQAWELNRDHYIVLLIRYNGSYRSFQDIVDAPVRYTGLEFRVGVSHNYKPKYNEALAAFTSSKGVSNEKSSHSNDEAKDGNQSFERFFLSSSINQFMNEQFISLLKIRHAQSLDWDGAKRFYMKQQGRPTAHSDTEPGPTLLDAPSSDRMETDSTDDHLSEAGNVENCSLPLVAMQFALRYITQCTKYCLVCHNKTEETFEALKPYVCSNPLCLFQYMQLGFGTSIEHEILTQPYVVDLLISFCYTAAASQKLREYPVGMNLRVPAFGVPVQPVQQNRFFNPTSLPGSPDTPSIATSPKMAHHTVNYHSASNEAIVSSSEYCKLHPGDWVCIRTFDGTSHLSGRISNSKRLYNFPCYSQFPFLEI